MKALFKEMRSDLRDFPTTAQYRNLKSSYWNNPKLIQRDVKPLWNLKSFINSVELGIGHGRASKMPPD